MMKHSLKILSLLFLLSFPFQVSYSAAENKKPGEIRALLTKIDKHFQDRDFEKVISLGKELIPRVEKELGKFHLTTAFLYNRIGFAYSNLRKFKDSISYFLESLKIYEKIKGTETREAGALYLNLANGYQNIGSYQEAANLYKKAQGIITRLMGKSGQMAALVHYYLGRSYYTLGKLDKSIEESNLALGYYQKAYQKNSAYIALVYNNLAEAWKGKARFEKALFCLNKALEIYGKVHGRNHPYLASLYINLGEVYRSLGEIERSIEYHARALTIYDANPVQFKDYVGTAHVYIGGAFKSNGDYESALHHYFKALDIYLRVLGKDHPFVATTYVNLGGAYELSGELDKASFYYHKALPIYLKNLGDTHPYLAVTYNNMALIHYRKKNYDVALRFYRKSLDIYLKTLQKDHPDIGRSYLNMALLNQMAKRPRLAEKSFSQALAVVEKNFDRALYVHTLKAMANFYHDQGKFAKAREKYQKAVDLIIKYRLEFARGKSSFLARYMDIFNWFIQMELELSQVEKAFLIDTLKRGLSISENMTLKDALNKGGVANREKEKLISFQNRLIQLLSKREVLLNQGKQKELDDIQNRIWRTEQAIESFDKELVKKYDDYAKIRELKAPKVRDIQKSLSAGDVMISFAFMPDGIFAFVLTRDKPIELFRLTGEKIPKQIVKNKLKNFHALYKSPRELVKLEKIKTKEQGFLFLDSSENANYFKKNNTLYLKKRKQRGLFLSLKVENNTGWEDKKIGTILGRVTERDVPALRNNLSKEIYQILFEPIISKISKRQGQIKRLVIIPDGVINYLPIALLKNSQGNFLLKEYRISFVHSAIVWQMLSKNYRKEQRLPLFAMGNAVYNKGHKEAISKKPGRIRKIFALKRPGNLRKLKPAHINNLPGTREELEIISKIAYPHGKNAKANSFSGIRANEDIIFQFNESGALRKYRILHFAAHGLFVDKKPELNAIILSIPGIIKEYKKEEYKNYKKKFGDLKRDGFLRLGEVKTLNLNADLVVLSACETSIGDERPGEGMVGLPQAFLISGSKTVIASLWPVDDEATSILMEELYKNILQKEMDPVSALREAQLSLAEEFTDPYFWGAFIIFGK